MAPTQELMDHLRRSAEDGSPRMTELKQKFASKSPDEQAVAARKAFYGIVEPALLNGEPLDHDAIEQVEAIFETCWENLVQQTSGSRTRTGSRSSGSS